jgi:transposase-like protein
MKLARDPRYSRHRSPAEVISDAIWLYFRFPLSLRLLLDIRVQSRCNVKAAKRLLRKRLK